MVRRIVLGVLAAGVVAAAGGCRSSCGERRGLFGLCHRNQGQDAALMGYSGKVGGSDCYAGEPIPGTLTSFPGMSGVPALPPSVGVPPTNELPMPSPSDLIPGQRVPFAPPSAAPAPLDASMTGKGARLK